MARVYFTADTHFGHAGILHSTDRPFATIREHDEALLHAWNAVVGLRDTVYHVGDFALTKDVAYIENLFRKLHGRKVLIVGNHDRRWRKLPWAEQHEGLREISVEGLHVVLCHFPMRSWPRAYKGALHLYGHTHGSLPGTRRSCDVGVDVWDFRPVALPEILDQMALSDTWPEELQDS